MVHTPRVQDHLLHLLPLHQHGATKLWRALHQAFPPPLCARPGPHVPTGEVQSERDELQLHQNTGRRISIVIAPTVKTLTKHKSRAWFFLSSYHCFANIIDRIHHPLVKGKDSITRRYYNPQIIGLTIKTLYCEPK